MVEFTVNGPAPQGVACGAVAALVEAAAACRVMAVRAGLLQAELETFVGVVGEVARRRRSHSGIHQGLPPFGEGFKVVGVGGAAPAKSGGDRNIGGTPALRKPAHWSRSRNVARIRRE